MSTKKEKNVEIICSSCGYNHSDLIIMEGPKGTIRMAYCKKCGGITLNETTPNPDCIDTRSSTTYDANVVCKNCGHNISTITVITDDTGTLKTGECKKCKQNTLFEFNKDLNRIDPQTNMPTNSYGVTCPFCKSTNCKKISGASKVGKVALFGVFAAGSVSKTWHCNNCGSNFG